MEEAAGVELLRLPPAWRLRGPLNQGVIYPRVRKLNGEPERWDLKNATDHAPQAQGAACKNRVNDPTRTFSADNPRHRPRSEPWAAIWTDRIIWSNSAAEVLLDMGRGGILMC